MTPLFVVLALIAGAFLGRFSCRRHVDQVVRNPKLWWALAVFLLSLNSTGLSGYVVSQNSTLEGESQCRAELAGPVNDATAKLTTGQARGLLVFIARALDDPAVSEAIGARFGTNDTQVLRQQALAIIEASDALERANEERTANPVAKCN